MASLRCRLRCPVNLLVIAIERSLARWCAHPIELGDQGWVLEPWVIGPSQVPVVTDAARVAESPELGILSVAAHGREPGAENIALAAIAAAHTLDDERASLYTDLVYYFLGTAARTALEALMQTGNYQYQSDFARKYYAEGRTEGRTKGRAEGLLLALELAGHDVPERLRKHILACSDVATFDTWYERIRTARTLDEVFDRAVLDDEEG